jgi:hypothetical protein
MFRILRVPPSLDKFFRPLHGLWVPKTCRNHQPAGWRLCDHAARRSWARITRVRRKAEKVASVNRFRFSGQTGFAAPAIPYDHPACYGTSDVAECMSVMWPPSGSQLVSRGQTYPVIRGRHPML